VKQWSAPEVVFPGLAANAAYCAAPIAAQAATSVSDNIAKPTDGKVPDRLDEALQYAVALTEKDPRNVAAIVRYLGWDGHDATNEGQPGRQVDLPPRRLRHVVERAVRGLRTDGTVPEAVERSIALVERSLPILDMELCEALLNARLCYVRFSCGALATAAAVFRKQSPFEIVRLGCSVGLVKSGTVAGINQLAAQARSLMRSRGWANVIELTDDAQAMLGPSASRRFTEEAVRTVERFEWLDQNKGCFWYMPDRGRRSNRLVDQIQRILAATPRIRLAELRSAIRRNNGFGSFAPPLGVLASICRRLLFVQIDGDAIVRVPDLAQWDLVLSPNETILVDVLRSHGPVLGREQFLEYCRERGMNEDTFNLFTSHSVILNLIAPGMYALVGATIPAGTIDAVGRLSSNNNPAKADHGCLSDGRIFLSWKLDSNTMRSGVLRVPEPMNASVEGEFRLKTIANRELGCIQVFQRACWDVRRLLQYACSEAEDTLVIVLNLRDYNAIGILGDETIADQIKAGDFDLDAVLVDTDQQTKERDGASASPSIAV
jgi:hypothetical protein